MTRAERLNEALGLLAFYEGAARPEFPGAQPTVRINGQDFQAILDAVRAALAPESGGRELTGGEFNVNNEVWVRLTDLGRATHRKHWTDLLGDPPAYPFHPKPEKDGWSRWQLWDLMAVFGGLMSPGQQVPFETTIRLTEPPANSTPAAAQPDPKDLEITERDRWAWRLGWSAAMSIRLDRPVNPSDAPEPPATAPRPGEW